ncbi:MAG: RNA-binding S4 domain-containing protein [Lachnospiraceae bacterium]|nr:RNA-binding S4 domain-containing protein [Lachnospiraceae bacterium]
MEFKLKTDEEMIKLGQLLKAADLVESGSEAKIVIQNGEVKVNDEVCLMRGKKIKRGDRISFMGKDIEIS